MATGKAAASCKARAWSGDASAALLQPHQLLMAQSDALLLGVVHLELVRVRFAGRSQPLVALECLVHSPQSPDDPSVPDGSAALAAGNIQLHPWVLDISQQLEGALATVERQDEADEDSGRWHLTLSVQAKYPPVASTRGASSGLECGGSRVELLPESVRQGQIDLERAVQRQLHAAGTLRAPRVSQLFPVRLLQETYVFRIDAAKREENCTARGEPTPVIRIAGWSSDSSLSSSDDSGSLTERVAALRIQEEEGGDGTAATSYEDELSARLWDTGFAGYGAFVQDVLLNLGLVLRRRRRRFDADDEEEQIGSHGVLISGVHGVGKSLALVAIQRELARERIATWRVDAMSLLMAAESPAFPTTYEYLARELEQHFPDFSVLDESECGASSSSCVGVVLLDDLDMLFQSPDGQNAGGNSSDTQLPQMGSALLRLVDELSSRNAQLVVVGTTASADANMPQAAKRTGRFGKVVDLVVPTEQTRREILERHLSSLPLHNQEGLSATDLATSLASRLAALTGGYVAKDLVRICRNAAVQAHAASVGATPLSVGWAELLLAQQQIKPSQLRELNVASPGAPGNGKLVFAGYAAVQKQLFDFISWKFHPTAAMNRLGIANASGILLSGPSGCGKTLLVQTLAAQAQVNFVSVKVSVSAVNPLVLWLLTISLLRSARARAASPCLLFFDEFDAIAHKRSFGEGDGGSSGGGVYARVLSTFLNEMDGVGSQRVTASSASHVVGSGSSGGGILVVAATNRKDALDAALIRPGRIDKTVELGFPTPPDIQVRAVIRNSTRESTAFRALREDLNVKTVGLQHFEAAWDQRAEGNPTYTIPAIAKSTGLNE
ncbi:hypothetical protein BBJ28_00011163 [Nothophytophthora sp. Chile5]|nr:hypothetical protein BBJ28_00011163 [Nothophytophthora sp. Chile5]